MKKALYYCDEFANNKSKSLEQIIQEAQIEAIEETCKVCAENADIEVVDTEFNFKYGNRFPVWGVSSDSILKCAEILKKEIE